MNFCFFFLEESSYVVGSSSMFDSVSGDGACHWRFFSQSVPRCLLVARSWSEEDAVEAVKMTGDWHHIPAR